MPTVVELCRKLRRNETYAEKILWEKLRNRKFMNKKFLRQTPLYTKGALQSNHFYIPDFYCHEAKLVIEADGAIHLLNKEYDEHRDAVLLSLGYSTLRFTNEEIINNISAVLKQIKLHLISSRPLSAEGEERGPTSEALSG